MPVASPVEVLCSATRDLLASQRDGTERASPDSPTNDAATTTNGSDAATPNGSDAATHDSATPASDSAVDWPRVRALARHHGLTPLLHRAIDAGALPAPPDDVRAEVADAAASVARTNLQFARGLHEVLDLLEDASVRALPFKGPVLATAAYGDVGARRFDDVDVLVPPADVPAAVAALRDGPFALETELGPLSVSDLPDGRDPIAAPTSVELRHEATNVGVDLRYRHWDAVGDRRLDVQALWADRASVAVGGRDCPALSPTDRLVVLATHGTGHSWRRLQDLADLAAIAVAPGADWHAALERADARGTRPDLLLGARLAASLLDADVPERLLADAAADDRVADAAETVERRLRERPAAVPTSIGHHRLRARLDGDAASRFGRLLTRPTLDDYELLALPEPLWPLYPAVVPIRVGLQAYGTR